jgi:hypothetical protein
MLCGDGVTDMPGTAHDVFHPYNNFSPPIPSKENLGGEQDRSSFNLLVLKGWLVHVQQESKLRDTGWLEGEGW